MAQKLKVGIIGCGGIANGKHMPALKKLDTVEMVAFCDIIVDRAEKAKETYGTPDAKVYERSLLSVIRTASARMLYILNRRQRQELSEISTMVRQLLSVAAAFRHGAYLLTSMSRVAVL